MRIEALRLNRVSIEDYWFGGTRDVTFTLYRAEAVVLTGLFNSGVKTVVNLLAGEVKSFGGQVFVRGKEISTLSCETARSNGIAVVGNRSLISDGVSFKDNIAILRGGGKKYGIIKNQPFSEEQLKLVRMMGLNFSTEAVHPFERIKWDILLACLSKAEILVITNLHMNCNDEEMVELAGILSYLKDRGMGIIIESLGDAMWPFNDVADRCLVIRNGVSTNVLLKKETGLFDFDEIRHVVLGRKYYRRPNPPTAARDIHTDDNHIKIVNRKSGESLTLQQGEIIGVYDESFRIPTTIDAFIKMFNTEYKLVCNGKPEEINSPIDFVKNRISVIHNVEEDKMIFKNLSPEENVSIFVRKLLGKSPIYDSAIAEYIFDKVVERHSVLKGCAELRGRENCFRVSYQQSFSLMLAKWLAINPDVVIMFTPLCNDDIKFTERYRGLQQELKQLGKTVVLISTDFDRLDKYCSEIYTI